MIDFGKGLVLSALAMLMLAGCSAPTATLDLITVAQKGVRTAQESESQQHQEILRHMDGQLAALDSAFDADVHLAAAGQVKKADGTPVEFTGDWVISARKGYVAARDTVNGQIRSSEAAHAVRQDNLKAADEALAMASQLIVQQWNVGEQIKQRVLDVQRRLLND